MKSSKYLKQIGESKLKEWLHENYNLTIQSITPIPKGTIGDSYVIENFNKQKYFLKIHLQAKLHTDKPNGLKDTLKLTSQLHDSGIKNVPYPIKLTDGKLEGKFGMYSIIVTNFIDGNNPKITRGLTVKLAKIIAQIHQININSISLPVEPPNVIYANKLNKQLKILKKDEKLNESQKALGGLLFDHEHRLQKHLLQLNQLYERVKQKKSSVITHGDLILDNLIVNKQGHIFIVDWDWAEVSPPERDIWFFMGEYGQNFIQTYKKFNPSQKIDTELLSFYMYKRYIEDLVYWADQILFENFDEKQSKSSLNGIKICCLKRYENIEKKIENIKKIILQ